MYNVTSSTKNKDIPAGMSRAEAKQYYLNMWGNFNSKIEKPIIEKFGDKFIFRADYAPGGLKAFGAEKVVSECTKDTLVYCAPRQGHAPDAIAMLAKMYDKKCVFFMPSSKVVSDHQASIFSYDHVDVRFFRIAAMPVLNKYAKDWAEANNAQYLPFGLTGNPTVTSGLVNAANMITEIIGQEPSEIWCAVSTGTMIRALQIGWPNSVPHGVAVARNIHDGEIGDAIVVPATMPFLKPHPIAKTMPFPTTAAYDAKAWEDFVKHGKRGAIFINVGSDEHIKRNMSQVDISKINSFRPWHDLEDANNNRAFV